MIYRTTDPGRWGAGKGAPLTASEADANIWDLNQRIDGLQNNPVLPAEISGFAVSGRRMTITMSDGRAFGPFALPIAAFRWRGSWAPAIDYAELDTLKVDEHGLFLVLENHTSAAEFDLASQGVLGPLYHQLFGPGAANGGAGGAGSDAYDIGFFLPGGIPADGSTIFHYIAPRAFTLPGWMSGTQIALLEAATTQTIEFAVRKNGAVIGTFQFIAGIFDGSAGIVMTWPGDGAADELVSFIAGDTLSITAPTVADATAGGLAMTFKATRDPEVAA